MGVAHGMPTRLSAIFNTLAGPALHLYLVVPVHKLASISGTNCYQAHDMEQMHSLGGKESAHNAWLSSVLVKT